MRRRMRLRVLLAGAVLPLALWAALPVFSQGAASPTGRLGDIQHKIRVTQGKIGKRKGTERLLTTHANVMWNASKSLRFGIEHIFAQRWLEDDGTTAPAEQLTGDMHRIQAAARFQF